MRARAVIIPTALAAVVLGAWHQADQAIESQVSTAITVVNPSSQGDARIVACGPGARALVILENSGAAAAGYTVEVAFRLPDQQVASSGVLQLSSLGAHRSRTVAVPGPPSPGAKFTCSLTDVQRRE